MMEGQNTPHLPSHGNRNPWWVISRKKYFGSIISNSWKHHCYQHYFRQFTTFYKYKYYIHQLMVNIPKMKIF